MAIQKILTYPNPKLALKSEPVTEVNQDIRALIRDMAETMYAAPGVGLAAPQIGVLKRVIVIDVQDGENGNNLIALVNPEIVESEGRQVWEEGCLSVPGVTEEVKRAERVRAKGLDQDGEPVEIEGDGLLAVALQHEIDHLDGVLFIDRLSTLKRNLIRKRIASGKIKPDKGPAAGAI